jgi:hypothetical protein
MGKKLKVSDLRDRRADVEQDVLRIRAVMEGHRIELEKLNSPANRRMLSELGLRDKETQLRNRTHESLAKWRSQVIKDIGDSYEHQHTFTREHAFRSARFAQEFDGPTYSVEGKMTLLLSELLEATRRSTAERRAERLTPEDLATEAGRAAENGDVALVSVFTLEASNRKLAGLEKLSFDTAIGKLSLPEVQEAEELYGDLASLTDEADSLLELWVNPRDEGALARESLARFNRKKAAEKLVAETIAEGERAKTEELQQSSAA